LPHPVLSPPAVARVSRAWRELAGDDTPEHGSCVVVGRPQGSGIAPAGWVGIVTIDGDTIVSVPGYLHTVVEGGLGGRLDRSLTDLENVARILVRQKMFWDRRGSCMRSALPRRLPPR
jgi:hypothetical protein